MLFAKVADVFHWCKIECSEQTYNFDEADPSTGCDINKTCSYRVVINAWMNAKFPKQNNSDENQVSTVGNITFNGDAVCTAAVPENIFALNLSVGNGFCQKLTAPLLEERNAFWRQDIASVDISILFQWNFVSLVHHQRNASPNELTVFFYNALTAHIMLEVIITLRNGKMAVETICTDISDRDQALALPSSILLYFLLLCGMLRELRVGNSISRGS